MPARSAWYEFGHKTDLQNVVVPQKPCGATHFVWPSNSSERYFQS